MAKDKRRNTEKRKEKSRDAARCRRGKESEVFVELADCLPLPESVSHQLDKASIMRLAISVFKISSVLEEFSHNKGDDECDTEAVNESIIAIEQQMKECMLDQMYQRALEGFTFILSHDGDFVYLSESVAKYLGLTQIELMGQSIYDFTHPCDHEEIRDLLTMKSNPSVKPENGMSESKMCFLRLKCTLTSKGRNVNLKSASYKVMKCSGRLMSGSVAIPKEDATKDSGMSVFHYLVGVAEPIPHPSNIEVPLDCSTFLSKHSMDMKFLVCDERIKELAGYSCDEMIGQSFFDFPHAMDYEIIEKVFKDLFSKGQAVTSAYRLMCRNGGFIWVVTQATVIDNNRTPKPTFVVCVHYVLSGIEEQDTILSLVQKRPALSTLLPPKMEMCTENIFAPKKKDMEKTYFVPSELEGKITYRNNEPQDLSYLAPKAGEESSHIPFPSSTTDYLLSPASSVENYILKQEPGTPCPDINYHKDQSPISVLSPAESSRIPSPNAFTNPAVPVDVESMGQFFQSLEADDDTSDLLDNIDLDGRAPYIPMDGDEDLEIFAPSSNSLFTFSNDVNPGLFGRTESVFGSKQSLFEEPETPPKLSVRDFIDGSTAMASIEQPPDTMCLQMKRPLDKNSLEKGPPKKKIPRLEAKIPAAQPCKSQGSFSSGCKDSVLLNLLINGEDRNHGYKVTSLPGSQTETNINMVQAVYRCPKFPILTRQDCEVNAPTLFSQLLQGPDIMEALDTAAGRPMQKQKSLL